MVKNELYFPDMLHIMYVIPMLDIMYVIPILERTNILTLSLFGKKLLIPSLDGIVSRDGMQHIYLTLSKFITKLYKKNISN